MADIRLEVHNLRHTLTGKILPPVDIVDRLQACLQATPGSPEEPEIEKVIRAAIREIRELRRLCASAPLRPGASAPQRSTQEGGSTDG